MPGGLNDRLGLFERETSCIRHSQVLSHAAYLHVDSDRNRIDPIDLCPAWGGNHAHPHRPDLGTAEHWKTGSTSFVASFQVGQQFFSIPNAAIDHPAYWALSRI